MGKYATRLRDHLPTLYRPEANDESLLQDFLFGMGGIMDVSSEQLFRVMQAHWFRFADKATFDAHHVLDRRARGLPPVNVRDATDMLEVARYPYVDDLARLAAIIGIAPWREPPTQRELLENYRRRIQLYIQIYRRGLGTLEALRLITEAELPPNLDLPLPQRLRAFVIEEGVPFINTSLPVVMNGIPADRVGALMRWSIEHNGWQPVVPVVYFTGVEPVEDEIDATEQPMIERYQPGADLKGIALAYNGTLAVDDVLQVTPAAVTWLIKDDGLAVTDAPTVESSAAGQAYNGPWSAVAGAPALVGRMLYQTEDRCLWLAGNDAGEVQLWRFDGENWQRVLELEALAPVNALFQHRNELLIATDDGLWRMYLYPTSGDPFSATQVAHFSGMAVHALCAVAASGTEQNVFVGYADGVVQYGIDSDGIDQIGALLIAGIDVFAVHPSEHELLLGSTLGLLRHDLNRNRWHYFSGAEESELSPDWIEFTPAALPDGSAVFLPHITHIAVTPDRSVWLGGSDGLARYYARNDTGLVYKTVLEAYPDLIAGAVHQMHVDTRGVLWVAAQDGLYRYDGRDIAQYNSETGVWQSHGRADQLYTNAIASTSRGVWHYDRDQAEWQLYDYVAETWGPFSGDLRAIAGEPAVRDMLETPAVIGRIGSWDGDAFSADAVVPHTDFQVRCKPDETILASGGRGLLAALPELIVGKSTWRYLQLEEAGLTAPADTPWWSREGRLVPPPEREAAYPGRYRSIKPALDGEFDGAMFAYSPSAKLRMDWQ